MQEQELISISIESHIKAIAEAIFEQFGMTKSEAIELFYRQVALTKDIPFIQRSLNDETIEAIEMIDNDEELTTYSSFAQLRQELEV
ncbi:MAG: type II toxin-antitoxin system RelB/DinJ family antitoxin [Snowella sp.]